MTLDQEKKILIVGLGLIGGSYAAALSAKGMEVGAIDPDPDAIAFAEKKRFDPPRAHRAGCGLYGAV